MQTVRFKDFWGWIADNPYFVGQGQFIDGKNLSIRAKAPLVKPHYQASNYTTNGNIPICAVDNLFFCEGWEVYTTNSSNDTASRTITSWPDVLNAIKFDNNIVFCYEWVNLTLGYKTPWAIGSGWTDSWTTSGDNITTNSDSIYPMVEFKGLLYIGSGNNIYSVTAAWVQTLEMENLRGNVVGLESHWQTLVIFMDDGLIGFWDTTEDTFINEYIDIKLPIRGAYSTASETYVIAGDASSGSDTHIFRFVGYQRELIATYQNKGVEIFSDYEWNNSSMANSVGVVYMPWIVEQDGSQPVQWVYSYGTLSPKMFPPCWNYDFVTRGSSDTYKKVTMLHYYQGTLYVGYQDSSNVEWIDAYTLDPDAGTSEYTDAYIIMPAFDWGERNRKKKITRIRYHWSTASDVVVKVNTDKFYQGTSDRRKLLKDGLSDFTTLVTFDNTDSAEQNTQYGKAVDIEWYVFLFKVELGANSTLSELEVDFIYLD